MQNGMIYWLFLRNSFLKINLKKNLFDSWKILLCESNESKLLHEWNVSIISLLLNLIIKSNFIIKFIHFKRIVKNYSSLKTQFNDRTYKQTK